MCIRDRYKDHKLYKGDKGTSFMVDNGLHFRICAEGCKFKNNPNVYYAPVSYTHLDVYKRQVYWDNNPYKE